MRSLLLHANHFLSKVNEQSTRPRGIIPDAKLATIEEMKECFVVLYTVERQDSEKEAEQLSQEIIRNCQQLKVRNVMLTPFAHLSNNLASSEVTKSLHQLIFTALLTQSLVVLSSHFGYHKSWLLDIKGHRCAYKYREFYSTAAKNGSSTNNVAIQNGGTYEPTAIHN